MQGIGHEYAVEIEDREGLFDKVGFYGLNGDLVGGRLGSHGLLAVDGIDGAAGLKKGGEGAGEEAASTAEVRPARGMWGFGGCGRKEGKRFGWGHAVNLEEFVSWRVWKRIQNAKRCGSGAGRRRWLVFGCSCCLRQ